MRNARIQGVPVHRRPPKARRRPGARPAPDLVLRPFTAPAPDRVWVPDVTYLRTREGFLHLAAGIDLCSRRVVAWAMAPHGEFVGTLKLELIRGRSFPTRAPARTPVFDYIDCFDDRRCRQSSIGNVSPEEYERRYPWGVAA